jgi:hypothetical protein
MAASLTTDTLKFRKGVEALAKQYGVNVRGVMLRQVSIAGGQLIKRFPPKNNKIGTTAIRNDMNRIFLKTGIGRNADIHPEGKITIGPDGMAIIRTPQAALFADPASGGIYRANSNLQAYHNSKLNAPSGRRGSAGRIRNQGAWTGKKGERTIIQNRMIVKASEFSKYLNKRKKSVGKLAAGWLPTLNIYRGPGAGSKPAAFVSRHGPGKGYARNRMSTDGSGVIEFGNSFQVASIWRRNNDFVMKSRERGMKKELNAAIRKAAREAGS